MLNRLAQALGLAGIALFTMSTPAAAAEQIQGLAVQDSDEYGEYLVTSQGHPVYLFTADSEDQSVCYDDCADAWPPVAATGDSVATEDEAVQEDLIGMIEREDGTEQVTYDGQPLYVFVRDMGSQEPMGHDIEGFGGEWYLVSPDGGKASADSDMPNTGPEAQPADDTPHQEADGNSNDGTDTEDGTNGTDETNDGGGT